MNSAILYKLYIIVTLLVYAFGHFGHQNQQYAYIGRKMESPTSTNRHQLQVTNIIVTQIVVTVFVTGTLLKNLTPILGILLS